MRMTETAARIGMNATQSARQRPADAGQLTTARDMALLGMALVKQFPEYYGFFHTQNSISARPKSDRVSSFLDLYAPMPTA